MKPRFLLLPILLLPQIAHAQAPVLRDSFDSYAPESDAAPAWASEGITFTVRGAGAGKSIEADGPDGRSWLDWKAAPFVDRGAFSARFTPQKATDKTGWRIAGVGFKRDAGHFWHLALVQPPQDDAADQKPRFVELSEMWGETWNAQGEPATRVQVLEESPAFAWDFGHSYRLEIAFEERGGKPAIRGEVFEIQGAGEISRWKRVHALQSEDGQNNVVSRGRPALTSGGLQVLIDDAALANARTVEAPPSATDKPVFPPYKVAPLPNAPKNLPAKKASGFFGLGQVGGKWWLFDPAGKATLSVATDHVNYNVHHSQAMGYAPYSRNLKTLFSSEDAWAKDTSERLKSWNFNVVGTNSSPSVRYRNQSHFDFLSFGQEMASAATLVEKTNWTGFPDVFDPRWERLCDRRAKMLCAPRRNDPWLTGYFLDNELEWWGKNWETPWGMAIETAKRSADSHGKRALLQVLATAYAQNLAAFNADFGRDLKSWDEFLTGTELGTPATPKAKAALESWLGEVARKYFQVTTSAVRKYDPNHLIWGARFAGNAPDIAWKWAGKTCDVVTVNIYPRVDFATLKSVDLDKMLRRAWTLGQRPVAVTEWSFPALDAVDSQGRKLPSKFGAGMRVDNQQQKAQAWAVMQSVLFQTPFVVGSHYFMWTDEPALGVAYNFPEDSNYGLVNEKNEPYAELTRVAKAINGRALQIHQSGNGTPPRLWNPKPQVLAEVAGAALVTESVDGKRFVRNGALKMEITTGGPLQVLAGDGTPLGSYRPMLQQVVAGQNLWTPADTITAVRDIRRSDAKIEMEIDFRTSGAAITEVDAKSGASAAQESSAPGFEATVRITVEAGKPYFLARAVRIKSLAQRDWTWASLYHYVPSSIGGDAKDDVLGGPDAPNYWMPAGAWTDASGWSIGLFAPRDDARLSINFWRDPAGNQHPDARRALDGAAIQMKPGQVWNAPADEPSVAIFGLKSSAANPRPWGDLALAVRMASQK
jgi:hypothetical protein